MDRTVGEAIQPSNFGLNIGRGEAKRLVAYEASCRNGFVSWVYRLMSVKGTGWGNYWRFRRVKHCWTQGLYTPACAENIHKGSQTPFELPRNFARALLLITNAPILDFLNKTIFLFICDSFNFQKRFLRCSKDRDFVKNQEISRNLALMHIRIKLKSKYVI